MSPEEALAAIRARRSCRTFDGAPIGEDAAARLRAFLAENRRGPFGGALRFELVDLDAADRAQLRSLGTYGVIRGATLFAVGAATRGPRALVEYGYGMERNVLLATALGLGTCWLGGTLKRAGFARRIGLRDDEILPAITPVGRPAGRRSLIDRAFRFTAGSDARKPWAELFFDGEPGVPLAPEVAGALAEALAAVRLAPSASNKQPWRIVRAGGALHLLLARSPGYDKLTGEVRLQEVDMGIAMCHLELAARALGLPGGWIDAPPPFDPGRLEPIAAFGA